MGITKRTKTESERTRVSDRPRETMRVLDKTHTISEEIVENMPASILVFDKDLRLVSANKNFYQRMGKKKGDVVCKTVDYVFYPVLDVRRIGLVDRIKEVFRTENSCDGERIQYRHILYFYRIRPLRDEGGDVTHVMLIMEDVTEVTKLEQEIVDMNRKLRGMINELRIADKIKDEFLSMISHELKTPLTPIRGYLDLLFDEDLGEINEKQKEALDISLRRVKYLQRMIDDIVDVSKLESKKMRFDMNRVNLNTIIENSTIDIKLLADEKGVELLKTIPPEPSYVNADGFRISQVLNNLLDNAIKFSPKGGKVTLNAENNDGCLHVMVSDAGPGISKRYHKKIFEKFYQTDTSSSRKFGGMGLGLMICKKIIEECRGKIWVESKVGNGSTFHFTLPITKNG